MQAVHALAGVWREAGGEPSALDQIDVQDEGQALPSTFAVSTAAAATVGAATLAAARLWQERGRPRGDAQVRVGTREASIAFRSERYLRVPVENLAASDALTGDYRTRDGGWVRLHCNYPGHRDAALRALGLDGTGAAADPAAVASAVRRWTPLDLEEAVIAAGGAAAAMRSTAQWAAHPQGTAVAKAPLLGRRRLGPLAAESATLVPAARPLDGVRVLDLTRVIAGPVAGRTLAAHGAQVLRIGANHLPLVPLLVVDTGFGKRFAHLDLRTAAGRDALRGLVARADVVLQAYRPGSLEHRGFGPEECAALRPSLVYVDIRAWGSTGPWRARRGFDSLVQMACGIADEERIAAGESAPHPLPAQVLDHATGFLAALGAIQGLRHRHAGGGGSHVEVSLARTAGWLVSLGRLRSGLLVPDPTLAEVADLMIDDDTPFGPVRHVRPPGTITGALPHWTRPPSRPGADPAAWSP